MGVETKNPTENFEKNRGLDPKALIKDLRDHGISVLASGILCMEHHTPDNIQIDIDHLVGMESDFVQFMLLIPLPVTELYKDYQKRGLLKTDLPFEDWHGQKTLNFNHPHFPGDSAERWIKAAFRQDYEMNSSSMYRNVETAFRGAQTLAAKGRTDPWLAERAKRLRKRTIGYAPILAAVEKFAVNELERQRARELERKIEVAFGSRPAGHPAGPDGLRPPGRGLEIPAARLRRRHPAEDHRHAVPRRGPGQGRAHGGHHPPAPRRRRTRRLPNGGGGPDFHGPAPPSCVRGPIAVQEVAALFYGRGRIPWPLLFQPSSSASTARPG